MHRLISSVLPFAIVILLHSCSTVKFYNKHGEEEVGIKTYSAKPYLLVEYSTEEKKEEEENQLLKNIKATVVYLPDLENPLFMKQTTGLGSTDLKVTLTNGMLTSYGLISDSKVPETITSIAGLMSAGKDSGGESELVTNEDAPPSFELFEILMVNGETKLKLVKTSSR